MSGRFKLTCSIYERDGRVTEKKSTSDPSEEEHKLSEVTGFLYDLEKRIDRDLKHISDKLKEALDRIIEKKIDYYL